MRDFTCKLGIQANKRAGNGHSQRTAAGTGPRKTTLIHSFFHSYCNHQDFGGGIGCFSNWRPTVFGHVEVGLFGHGVHVRVQFTHLLTHATIHLTRNLPMQLPKQGRVGKQNGHPTLSSVSFWAACSILLKISEYYVLA